MPTISVKTLLFLAGPFALIITLSWPFYVLYMYFIKKVRFMVNIKRGKKNDIFSKRFNLTKNHFFNVNINI